VLSLHCSGSLKRHRIIATVLTSDYIVLFLYMLGIMVVSIVIGARAKSAAELFAAKKQSPWWTAGLSSYMTMFSAGTFVVWGGLAYRLGMIAVAINLSYGIIGMIVGYFVAGRWKSTGINTPGEFIRLRYSQSVLNFYTWAMTIFRMISAAVALYSLAIMLVALMPLAENNPLRDPSTGNLSITAAIVIFGGTIVTYTMIGGLWGVLMTDVVQFIVLCLAVMFVLPPLIGRLDSWEQFFQAAPVGYFWPTAGEYTWYFLVGWASIHFFIIGAEWTFIQRYICVPTPADARKSSYLFGALYLVSPFIWFLPPMLYRYQNPSANPEQAYILACKSVLPPGMVGLMVAAMFSATAALVSAKLNVFAGVLTSDIYAVLTGRRADDPRLVTVGRLFTLLLGASLTAGALAVPFLGGAEYMIVAAASLVVGPLLAPMLWGLFSKRVGSNAVWTTVAISLGAAIVVKLGVYLTGAKYNTKHMDIVLGLVLPVSVLALATLVSRGRSAGWDRICALEKVEDERIALQASEKPAPILAWSLIACGIMMGTLAVTNSESRLLLGTFAAALILPGVIILGVVHRGVTRREHAATQADV
jgi:solute:Na+ symporter, SSS family